ncbi:MAG: outer membrane protein transport protein [Immundisolibacteraceae bacterium]|nr:outer membrane protein transport protein [Immundisolibacteraceae bacterium]
MFWNSPRRSLCLLGLALLGTNMAADANGINLEGLGTRAVNMGGAYIAVADDASAIFWNPAGLGQLQGQGRGIELGLYSMSTRIKQETGPSNKDPVDMRPAHGDVFARVYPSEPLTFDDNEEFWPGAGTIPSLIGYHAFDRFTVGYGVYGIAGAYSDYADRVTDTTTGAAIEPSIYSLMALIDFNLSIGMQVTDKLYLGTGVDLIYGYLNANATKTYRGSTVPTQPDYRFDLDTTSDGWGIQGNLGVLYKLSDQWSVGAVYRTGARFDLEGDTTANFNGLREKSDHYHRFVQPASWGLGVAYRPDSDWLISFDWTRTDWTKFKWPLGDVTYDNQGALLRSVREDPDWFPADAFHLGFEYQYSSRLALRGGLYTEESGMPGHSEGLTMSVSGGMDIVSLGFGYQFDKWTMDVLVGTMNGTAHNGTSHNCVEFGFTFKRTWDD